MKHFTSIKNQIPFGKYKGLALKQVPTSYLTWLDSNTSFKIPENILKQLRLLELKQEQEVYDERETDVYIPSEGYYPEFYGLSFDPKYYD